MREQMEALDDLEMDDLWERVRTRTPSPEEPEPGHNWRARSLAYALSGLVLAFIVVLVMTLLPLGDEHKSPTVNTPPAPAPATATATLIGPVAADLHSLSSPASELAAAGGYVWAAQERTDTVEKVDPSTGDVIATIALNGSPAWLASGTDVLWVALGGTETAVVGIDTETNEIVFTAHGVTGPLLQTDEGLWGFEYRAPEPNWMVVLDPRTGEVTRHVEIQTQPFDVAASGGSVWFLDAQTGTVQLATQAGGAAGAQVITDQAAGVWLAGTSSGIYLSAWRSDSAEAPGGAGTSAFAALDGSVAPFGDVYNFRPMVVAFDHVWFVAGPHDGDLSGLCAMQSQSGVVDKCADINVGLEGLHDPVAFEPTTETLWAISATGSNLYEIRP